MAGKLPPSGQKCERTVIPKEKFHSSSFRWKHTGDVHLLLACPKSVERGGKRHATRWDERAPIKKQCKLVDGKGSATLLVHNLVVPAKKGACRPNYKLK